MFFLSIYVAAMTMGILLKHSTMKHMLKMRAFSPFPESQWKTCLFHSWQVYCSYVTLGQMHAMKYVGGKAEIQITNQNMTFKYHE